ncbi:MAG TPA: ABC transporter substrate-binding protein [Methylomirabilota bacterium]|nr:ABC transporter substrate-binding protein [Methylomirabilota bacterium]
MRPSQRVPVLVFLVVSLLLAPALPAQAQQPVAARRVGVLTFTQLAPTLQEPLRQGLRDQGYVEGQNLLIEWRAADGRPERAKALAQELVGLKVDVIVANLTPAVQAAKEATATIPIVMASAGDPVGTGFVKSLARPGGNITGLTGISAELAGKRIELLRELVPGLTRVGLLLNGTNPFAKSLVSETRAAAKRAGLEIQIIDVRRAQDVDPALSGLTQRRAQAVIVDAALTTWRAAQLALQHRLPSISNQRAFVEAGGLAFHGAEPSDVQRRAAIFVAKILRGASPAELPVEQPTRFELILNLRTAKALGLTVKPALLLQATQTIE